MLHPNIAKLFNDVISLHCVGSSLREKLENLCGTRVIDLIYHLPVNIIDRRLMPDLSEVEENSYITSIITVDKHMPGYARRKTPYKVVCSNETGFITLVFFNARKDYITEKLPVGEKRIISGRVEKYDGGLQMSHPDYIAYESQLNDVKKLEPIYRLTQGMHLKTLIKIIREAIEVAGDLPEWIEPNFLDANGWYGWKASLEAVHNPVQEEDISKESPFYRRLAYDELLANQLALAIVREKFIDKSGQSIKGDRSLVMKLRESLNFKLTGGQEQVLTEIFADMENDSRMLRLLQGDVGSGKTIVALLAILNAIECGKQAVLMAPTEILARQHAESVQEALGNAGIDSIKAEILTGRDAGFIREQKLKDIKNGEINILIGTHALFQEGVEYDDLGLVVIDEQHRFGVKQRLALTEKGDGVDILLMTATPIPRTLALTFYGDIEISSLKEKPSDRKPIDTRAVPISRINEIVEGLRRIIEENKKVYWICPLVEELEESDLAAVEGRFKEFKKIFGKKVGMVHGRMRPEEKDKIMQQFVSGDAHILIATTVVEVGVNVPEATAIIIEHAERFGLSQLHQLRGRVGRSDQQSSCILLYANKVGDIARKRLHVIRETNDGFRIAEEDLDLRGAGEVLGTKQSGMPDYKIASIMLHRDLLLAARDDAKMIIQKDPNLKSSRGESLRNLLRLFEYNKQVKYLQSG